MRNVIGRQIVPRIQCGRPNQANPQLDDKGICKIRGRRQGGTSKYIYIYIHICTWTLYKHVILYAYINIDICELCYTYAFHHCNWTYVWSIPHICLIPSNIYKYWQIVYKYCQILTNINKTLTKHVKDWHFFKRTCRVFEKCSATVKSISGIWGYRNI